MKKAFLIFAVTILSLLFLSMCDKLVFDGLYLNNLILRDECNFKVPKKYKIVSDGKYFAVEVSGGYEHQYLWQNTYYITTMSSKISNPTLFLSECKAKAFLKKYLEQNEDKAINFK
jgi:hypothetical protein